MDVRLHVGARGRGAVDPVLGPVDGHQLHGRIAGQDVNRAAALAVDPALIGDQPDPFAGDQVMIAAVQDLVAQLEGRGCGRGHGRPSQEGGHHGKQDGNNHEQWKQPAHSDGPFVFPPNRTTQLRIWTTEFGAVFTSSRPRSDSVIEL